MDTISRCPHFILHFTPVMLNSLLGNLKMHFYFLSFLSIKIAVFKSFFMENKNLFVLYNQYHGG